MDSAVSVTSAPISDSDTVIKVESGSPNFDDFDRVDEVKKELKKKVEKENGKKIPEKGGNDQVPEAELVKEEDPKKGKGFLG